MKILRTALLRNNVGSYLAIFLGICLGTAFAGSTASAEMLFLNANGFYHPYDTAGISGGTALGGGIGLGFRLAPRIGFLLEGQYITEVLSGAPNGNAHWVMVPASLAFHISPGASLIAGGFYSFGSGSNAGATDDGVHAGLRFGVGPLFVDGRYLYGLKADPYGQDTRGVLVEVGLHFR